MNDTDIAVVGGGPAGIAAASRAAEAGMRVSLIDESPQLGGQIWRHRAGGHGPAVARRWLARLQRSGAQVRTGASVFDAYVGEGVITLGVEESARPTTVRAAAVVLATGARERFIPFPGWTLTGVIGIGGAQALLKAGTSFADKRVVIAGSGPLLLPVAAALTAAGARVILVAEQASLGSVSTFAAGLWRRPRAVLEAMRYRGGFLRTPYRTGTWVREARGDAGTRSGLREVVLTTESGASRTIACDVLCTGYGLVPNTELARLLGCETRDRFVVVDAAQRTTQPNVFCAGEPTGIGGVDLALVEGEIAGVCAAGSVRGRGMDASSLYGRRERLRALAAAMERTFAPREALRACATPETIVCRCEDVTLGGIDARWSPRQAKLLTRAGMGPCQGRVCGAGLAFLYGWTEDVVRNPVSPALLGTLHRIDGP